MNKHQDFERASQIEELILTSQDFSERLKVYSDHYSIMASHGNITTKGSKDEKIFCMCSTCSKLEGFTEKLSIYNRFLKPELDTFINKLAAFDTYKDRLTYFNKYFDINATYLFEDFDIKLSVRPNDPEENKVFNEFQYQLFLERYFLRSESSMSEYFQRDFEALRKMFALKKLNATYPEQSALKEITLLNTYFDNHWNQRVNELYNQLNDGITIDFTSSAWEFNRCLEVVEASEGVKFLRYLEGLSRTNSASSTESFREIIRHCDEFYGSLGVVTWSLVDNCIREIKDRLYLLSNDNSRSAYLKTKFLDFKIEDLEEYFCEIEGYLGNDIKVNQGLGATGNIVSVTSTEKYSSNHEGIAAIIHGRNGIVLEVSEHIADVYPSIDFSEVMKVVDYKTKSTFWIMPAKFEKSILLTYLKGFPIVEKQYRSALEKIENGIYERNALDDLRLSLELLLKDILGNEKSLENQRAEFGKYLSSKLVSPHIANMLWTLIEHYSRYQNNSVKHNDKIQDSEINFILELTNSFMKHLIEIK